MAEEKRTEREAAPLSDGTRGCVGPVESHDALAACAQLGRVHEATRRIHRLIVTAQDPAHLVLRACEILTETAAFATAEICLMSPAGPPLAFASSSKAPDAVRRAELAANQTVLACFRAGLAATEEPAVLRPLTAEACAGCPVDCAARCAPRVCSAVTHDGKVLGALVVTRHPESARIPNEHLLVREIAQDLGFALAALASQTRAERFGALFASSRDAVMTLAPPSWHFTSCNAATVRLFGARDEADFLSRGPWDCSPPVQADGRASAEKAAEMIAFAMEEGSHFFEWDHQTLDGRVFPATVLLTRTEYGGESFLQATVRDNSERKALQRQLFHVQKLQSLGRLAGGIAHDFNNLLTAIISFAQLTRDAMPRDDARREDLDEVLRAAESATHLTSQLLSFARRKPANHAVLELNAAVASTAKLLDRTLGDAIQLVVRPAPAPLFVRFDAGQLEQVILNLALNAKHAMPSGGTLTLTLEAEDELGDLATDAGQAAPAAALGPVARLAVTDTGCGMPPEVREQAFEPFFTTKGDQGTGLGLSTCYGIVSGAGGTLSLQSREGAGTTVTLRLPLVEKPRLLSEPAPESQRPRPSRHGGAALAVEDQPAIRRLMARALEGLGYRVLQARSAEEALSLLAKEPLPIELLLADVTLPGMSGADLAKRLRAARPELPVLLTSGAMDEVQARAIASDDASVFLAKPFSGNDLVTALDALLACPVPRRA